MSTPPAPAGAAATLTVLRGPDQGKQLRVTGALTQVGRGADQDLMLADIAASRRHCQLIVEGARYRLTDLGSGNGTLLNGTRTPTALLCDGDQFEVGNTLVRFEHAASRATAPSPPVATEARTMLGESPLAGMSYSAPAAPPMASGGPPPAAPPPVSQPAGPARTLVASAQELGLGGGPTPTVTDLVAAAPRETTDTSAAIPIASGHGPSRAILLAVGAAVLLASLAGAGVVAWKRSAGPDPEQLFLDGQAAFKAGEYERARGLFVLAAPKVPQAQRYVGQCDLEVHARGALKTARAMVASKQYEGAFKALDTIDRGSVVSEEVDALRKTATTEAASALVSEARELVGGDAAAAKQKLAEALAMDPQSEAARTLSIELSGGAPNEPVPGAAKAPSSAAKGKSGRAERHGKEASPTPEAAIATAPPPATAKPPPPEAPAAPATPAAPAEETVAEAGGDLLGGKAASAAYRARDFAGAAQALRLVARSQKAAAAQKSIALAAQVARVGEACDKAEAHKGADPAAAAAEYQRAAELDAQVAKGTHASYLKGQTAKLAKAGAQKALADQKYDRAADLARLAQKSGGDDGGVLAQLKAKATELATKAVAMQKANPQGAQTLWKSVRQMVPASDPLSQQAQKALAGGGARDEDED